ncbi:MAG: hypothetical protein KGI93_04570 [Acidobacteriota bacterium]|nr:hypothetical protein [Acidobacteriota bacterium]MDE3190018.1 hypothetical protein [Acidobacteriota bacterium]
MARRASAIAAAALVAVGVVVLGLWLWLGSYAPLRALSTGYAPGPGIGADVQPVSGSGGRPVFFPFARRHEFDTAFTLKNTGRFAVTVTGLAAPGESPPPWLGPTDLLATTSSTASADPGELVAFSNVRIDPGDTAIVVVRFGLRCAGTTSASPDVFTDGVRLRYRYLSMFTRTQTVRLPFAVTLRCVGGPPASP